MPPAFTQTMEECTGDRAFFFCGRSPKGPFEAAFPTNDLDIGGNNADAFLQSRQFLRGWFRDIAVTRLFV